MAIPDNIQTLTAAFTFGILLQAASGALFIYYKGHGPNILQDGRRLVLVLFLLFAALWAQFGFLNLMLSPTATGPCQALLIFTTMFDQLARVGVQQFFVWALGQGTKATTQQMVLQGIVAVRLVAGGILVGFTRSDFAPVCVARTSVLPTSIVVLVLDVIIIGALMIRASSQGVFSEMGDKRSSTRQLQSRALIFSIAGFTVWTGMSVPMLLGIPTIVLILRTTLPSSGLLILVGIVTMFQGALLLPRDEEGTTPEAHSPFITPAPPSREIFRGNVVTGSPVSAQNYTKSGNLFVVNPSLTPRDSPTSRFQSNYQGDSRGFTKLGMETNVRAQGGEDQDRPISKNGPGYRGSSGVFPSFLTAPLQVGNQVAMAPPIKSMAMDGQRNVTLDVPTPAAAAQQKRSLFNWSKSPVKPTVRHLGISQPVMDAGNESVQPFARMPTIDLATAAANERERREGAAARSRLVASRPAPLPPAQEGLRRSISTKRKEMPSLPKAPMPTIPGSDASGRSVDLSNGNSTSASLSPGREEVRRRSPRNMNSFSGLTDENKSSTPPALQRKGTIGLPSNPRSNRITMAREPGLAKEQTVMFINDIVYDDPGMVNNIISAAPNMYAAAKRPKTAEPKLSSDIYKPSPTYSIMHRPRPIRRDSETERAIFPSEPSPRQHNRSKSGSSLIGRRSLFMPAPGSPTQLPPLPHPPPPPPTSASKLKRLLPNDTKSMTFDEKIELLFPAPPGAPSIHNRRSSVPSLPRLPSVFMSDTPHAQSPNEEDQQSRRQSKRTTIASFGIPEVPKPEPSRTAERQTYRFSANTYRNIADEVGETWIPGITPAEIDLRNSVQEKPKPEPAYNTRQKSTWTETTASVSSFNDDATTYWGSLHSEFQPVDLSKARQTAKATLIQRRESRPQRDSSRALPPLPPLPQTEFNDGEEIMTVMLDDGEGNLPILSESGDNRRSVSLGTDQALPGNKVSSPRTARGWHRRIGDELPTFSERKVQTRSRKMPPPTPLLLNKNGRKATVVVRNTEPSPIDSPERAIQEIQAQLKRFEEPNRGSVGSIIRHLPSSSSVGATETPDDHRFKLLENLEREMGLQENQWQKMQNNIDRDSMSTVMSTAMSPAAPSPHKTEISRESSQRSSRTPSRVLSRRARIRSSMTRSKGEDSTSTTSTSSSDNSRASIWQQRLAEAQEEYLEKAPVLLRKRSLNFLSVSKSHQLGSPTPPDSGESGTELETDSESESGFEILKKQAPPQTVRKDLSLWKPSPGSPKMASGRLWNPPYVKPSTLDDSLEPPAKNIRPVQRAIANSLSISSSDLWSKPRSAEHSRPVVGLWGSKLVRPRSIVTRPLTQRPQRKSKRVTFLPDIVESPVPLPNKRDTLGIFQFPWGEKSDSAVFQPAFNPTLISGPIVNARLDARSRQLEPDLSEYSESFFDDYDEEQDVDIDTESDDDFDETTLWEIASLLNSRDVPSKNSLLPPSREGYSREMIEDYDEDTDFESETEEIENDEQMAPRNVAQAPTTKFPIQPLAPAPKETPLLWTKIPASNTLTTTVGLPQPEEKVWKVLVPAADDSTKSKPRASESLPVLNTSSLWTVSLPDVPGPASVSMWSAARVLEKSYIAVPAQEERLWQAPRKTEDLRSSGLFIARDSQTIVRTTTMIPAAINMISSPRSSTEALPTITSRSLWSRNPTSVQRKEWTSTPAITGGSDSAAAMWVPAKKEATITIVGLFSASLRRSDYRATSLMPAAINMTCKPRTSREPLSRLTSSKLWRRCERTVADHHWISESSIRPESPSIYSSASSGQSSPASDASSVKSTSTKASSLWGSIGSAAAAIPSWWESNATKKSPSRSPVDDPKHSSKIPLRQAAVKHLEPVIENAKESKIPVSVKHQIALRESRVLVSRDLAETKAPALESTPGKKFRRSVAPQQALTPVHKPIRHQHRPILAFRANWEEALADAIAAGTPRKTLTRPTVSRTDWAAALSTAVLDSQPRIQRPNTSAEMWQAALAEAIARSIVPPTLRTAKYDSAIRHPVFFTEKLMTSSTQIHPAAIGHVLASARQMWTTPSVAKAPKVTALWSKETATKRETPLRVAGPNEITRKAPVMKTHDLPALESSEFWKPTRQNVTERHWLVASTKVKSAQTWAPSLIQLPAKDVVNSSLWVAQKPTTTGSPDIFAHVRGESTKKVPTLRKVALPLLQTTELFGPISDIEPSTTHWLHTTSRMTESPAVIISSKPLIQGLTWTPSQAKKGLENDDGMKMWKSQSEDTVQLPALFSNPHTAPWEQKKRQPAPLKTIESTKMWGPSMAIPLSPKNWLVSRKFSKVEFRY